MSQPSDPSELLHNLNWRYATKTFDPDKKISAETWKTLEASLILTPSSYGLQPWEFIIVTDQAVKEKLLPHAWNQKQVTGCSHFVVFASKTTIDAAYIDSFLELTATLRGSYVASMKTYRGMMIRDLVHGARSGAIAEWAARQAYIALGGFMTVCAMLHIDACPMEGFSPAEFDGILNLTKQGLTASVCCAVGYRSEADKYATLTKVRFETDKMVKHI